MCEAQPELEAEDEGEDEPKFCNPFEGRTDQINLYIRECCKLLNCLKFN
jgi:hypothetical protein